MKKRIAALLLIAAMTAALSACGKDETESSAGAEGSASGETSGVNYQSGQIEYDLDECVTLGDYNNISVEIVDEYTVTDDDVKDYVVSLLTSYPVYTESDKVTVEDGDIVNIDYVGTIDGEEFDGGTGEDYNLTIGSGTFIDGFEDGLIGATVGETLFLDLTFPEDYSSEDLAGQDVTFEVTVNKIVEESEMAYDDMTDDYVSENFGVDTVDEFLSQVRESLEEDAESSRESAVQEAVLEKLLEICEVTVPEDYLDARISDYKLMFDTYCENYYDMTAEEFVESYQDESIDEYYAEIVTQMEDAIPQELILEAIAEKEGLEIDESEYEEFVSSYMSYYGYDSEEDFYNFNGGEDYVRKSYLIGLAITQVSDNATVTYIEASDDDTTDTDDTASEEE